MDELMDWTVCGRAVGKATGWDQADTFVMQLYGFEPAESYKGPVGECTVFNFERGVIETYDDDGNVSSSADLIDSVAACPVDRIE